MSNVKRNKRIIITVSLIVALCIIASASVYAAILYLRKQTAPVDDTFDPATLHCEITETAEGSGVYNLKNTSTISVYMRVSVDVVWQMEDESGNITVYRNHPAHTITVGANWIKSGDYYYYNLPLAIGDTVTMTVAKGDANTLAEDVIAPDVGYEYTVKIVPELIQAIPESARDEWGFFEFADVETKVETGTSSEYSPEY